MLIRPHWLSQRGALDAGAASYSGPGDVVSGAAGWWGLRAYSLAAAGGNAIRIRRSSDNTEQDIVTLSDGSLDVASVSSFIGGGNAFVVTIYDQSGNAKDMGQPTAANQAQLILNGLGALPVMRLVRASPVSYAHGSSITAAQPCTTSVVAKRTGSTTSYQGIAGNGTYGPHFNNSANNMMMYAGSLPTFAATDNTWHALQAVFNGASSVGYVDGASNSVSPGSNSLTGTWTIGTLGGSAVDGDITEVGIWTSAFDGTQQSNMDSNQRTYWGF